MLSTVAFNSRMNCNDLKQRKPPKKVYVYLDYQKFSNKIVGWSVVVIMKSSLTSNCDLTK